MQLISTQRGQDRTANIFDAQTHYIVELYIGDRLYRKMNVMETLTGANSVVESFLNEGKTNQMLLNENA